MPFTPFHMGPGLALKAIGGRRFSVLVFGIAQVAMDIEPLIGMLRNWDVLHGWTHTYAGATLIAVPVMLLAPALCRPILRYWNHQLKCHGLGWLRSPENITRAAAATGAFLGTWTHVALDSIMHTDIVPLSPWSTVNALQGWISINLLHVACIGAGLAGIGAWILAGAIARLKRPR